MFAGPSKRRDPSHVKLREIGWSMAQKVFQSSDVWPTKDANAFMAKHLCLVPEQKKELEKDLVQESILKDFEKVPSYKASYEYKNKMFASLRAQRTALVPLFKTGDEITKARHEVEAILDRCGAVIAPRDHPKSGHVGWGGETVPAAFPPLLSPPKLNVGEEPDELDLSDLNLDPAVAEEIQKRSYAKCVANRDHFKKTLETANKNFTSMYGKFARTVNFSSDSLRVFLRLHSVNDTNQRRLVRLKMANIFKPAFRRHLLKQSVDPSQGIFGGEEVMFKNMEESKKQVLLTKSIMLQTKKTGKGGNANAKKGKKPAAAGSKGKGQG